MAERVCHSVGGAVDHLGQRGPLGLGEAAQDVAGKTVAIGAALGTVGNAQLQSWKGIGAEMSDEERMPLWPPAEPAGRKRSDPSGRSTSSSTARTSAA